MIALISDLHSNMEAVGAVLDDIGRRRIERIICLGDVIGYGPEPCEALRLVSEWEACLRGNHEEAVLNDRDAVDFNQKAKLAINWTRDRLNDPAVQQEDRFLFWETLSERMVVEHRLESALLFHGSPRDPIREYILPRDAKDPIKMGEVFEQIDREFCFVGHSHVPGVYPQSGGYLPPQACADGYRLANGAKALINVGSVGQPRDGDPRACYTTWDGKTVRFHRVAYDFESTMRKIQESGGLPLHLAERLKAGR